MSLGTVTIEVSPQTAETLRQLKTQAEAQQITFDDYLLALSRHETVPAPSNKLLTPAEKARQWEDWVERNAVLVNWFVDDSRESIYREREDAQL